MLNKVGYFSTVYIYVHIYKLTVPAYYCVIPLVQIQGHYFLVVQVSLCVQCSAGMVAAGQGKKILQGQGNVRQFYSGSGKIGILKKSRAKLKL